MGNKPGITTPLHPWLFLKSLDCALFRINWIQTAKNPNWMIKIGKNSVAKNKKQYFS
jgi:hypothetical protein